MLLSDPTQGAEMLTNAVTISGDLLEISLNYLNCVYPQEENTCQPFLPKYPVAFSCTLRNEKVSFRAASVPGDCFTLSHNDAAYPLL